MLTPGHDVISIMAPHVPRRFLMSWGRVTKKRVIIPELWELPKRKMAKEPLAGLQS